MRLESQFWDALKDLAKREQADIGEICTRIARRAGRNNLSSAVRVAEMAYYRDLAFTPPPSMSARGPSPTLFGD
jgi:predicted DNA-binding ribbon-helix-helix protein